MKYTRNITPLVTFVLLLIIWEIIVRLTHIDKWILPSPSQTLHALWSTRQILFDHSVVTIDESISGLLVAIIIAFVISILMYFSIVIKKIIYPLLIVSQTIPFIALAPLLVIWFGFGLLPKILIVSLVCFFPIAVNLMTGFASIDSSMIANLKMLGANQTQIFRYAVLPASLSYFFSGIRIAGSYALLTAVIAEWIGASSGLGIFIIRSAKSYQIDQVFAAIIIISMISLVYILIIDQFYKLCTPWLHIKK